MKAPVLLDDVRTNPDGPPLRLRDLMPMTKLSRARLIEEIERGHLPAWRRDVGLGTPWCIERRDALAYISKKALVAKAQLLGVRRPEQVGLMEDMIDNLLADD